MSLLLQKKGRNITLTLSKELYPLPNIEKALQAFSKPHNSIKTKKGFSSKITFAKTDLSSVLEFANYLLYINR